ncbi:MAG TPA: hypothetical protein VF755_14870 [Catenuloplanes sp.]
MISSAANLAAEALFVSDLQPSEAPTAAAVRGAVTNTILRYGSDGCVASVAGAFGDHPDMAVRRMVWVREALHTAYPMTFSSSAALQLAH